MHRHILCLALLAVFINSACARGPLIDYDCAEKLEKKYGWDPVCVADGRTEEEGTLYPNQKVWEKCVTLGDNHESLPSYQYLPLECGSAVGCSLMGQAVDRCKKVWAGDTDTSPKVDDDCACANKTPMPKCEDGKKGCAKCEKGKCVKCLLMFRLTDGRCKKCQDDECRRCPASTSKCSVCKKYCKVKNGKCVEK